MTIMVEQLPPDSADTPEQPMNESDLKYLIEATLLAAGRPVPLQQLQGLFDERERPSEQQMQQALDALSADYAERSIELVQVASGWRIQVRSRCVDQVSRLWQERPARYSRALLETLALIAYRQPITRSEIEEIRGVSISSTIMRAMQERNWIRVVGHREVPGRPELLGTTREFLDYFGLRSLDQLPTLAELKDVETIGVQLELSAGDVPATDAQAAAAQPDAAPVEPVSDESKATSDGDERDEDPDAKPIMVAADEAAGSAGHDVREPARDQ
jgi:segregation and condensation protein B